jgi:hypothetical protein
MPYLYIHPTTKEIFVVFELIFRILDEIIVHDILSLLGHWRSSSVRYLKKPEKMRQNNEFIPENICFSGF